MAYFNHAFSKLFLGTQTSAQNPNVNLVDGFIVTRDLPTSILGNVDSVTANNNYGPGSYGLFDAKTYLSVTDPGCCPLLLASASLLANDKIGPFHGGYKESNKSKVINPKFVRRFYVVEKCVPEQAVISIGNTPETAGMTDPNNFQGGTNASQCCHEFLCGETYYLRIDIKGSPTLRYLNHQAYQTLSAYTGCCSGPTPTNVDSTLVMIEWAKALVINQYLTPFIAPVVFDEAGVAWYAPGTTVTYDGTNTPVHQHNGGMLMYLQVT